MKSKGMINPKKRAIMLLKLFLGATGLSPALEAKSMISESGKVEARDICASERFCNKKVYKEFLIPKRR